MAGALLYYFLRPEEEVTPAPTPVPIAQPPVVEEPAPAPPPVAETQTSTPDVTETEPEPEPEPLPLLSNSDSDVLTALDTVLPEGTASRFIVSESIIQKFVRAVIAITEGKVVNDYRPIESPAPGLKVTKLNEVLDPDVGQRYRLLKTNYSRYKIYVDLFDKTNKAMLAALYQRYYPLLDEAYQQQGIKNSEFHDALLKAIDKVLAVPAVPEEPILVQQKVYFQYFDRQTEKLPDVNKLLIRMGPENQAKLQTALREFKREIENK